MSSSKHKLMTNKSLNAIMAGRLKQDIYHTTVHLNCLVDAYGFINPIRKYLHIHQTYPPAIKRDNGK